MGQKQSRPPCPPPKSHLLSLGDPPFVSECEVYHEDEGGPDAKLLFEQCEKNPGHSNFIPVRDLSIEHLPTAYRSRDILLHIKDHCDKTVRVSVKYTSPQRPDTYPHSTSPYHFSRFRGSNRKRRWGTGTIDQIIPRGSLTYDETCPCHICRDSDNPQTEHLQLCVVTATHVVFDNAEAKQTIFELFYDSEDRKNVKLLYGVQVLSGTHDSDALFYRCSKDTVRVLCVTHDKELFDRFDDKMMYDESVDFQSLGIVISHPHGCCKHISIGNVLYHNYSFSSLKKPKDISIFQRISLKSIVAPEDSPKTFLFKLKKNIKCRLSGNSATKLDESLEKVIHYSRLFREYSLHKGSVLSLPPDATYLCRKDCSTSSWMEFPVGTKISANNGQEWLLLPAVEVQLGTHCFETYYITYDIPTCPGSSGAMITTTFGRIDWGWRKTHSGCIVQNGMNRSALLDPGFVQE